VMFGVGGVVRGSSSFAMAFASLSAASLRVLP
jgi:hypothetical protein